MFYSKNKVACSLVSLSIKGPRKVFSLKAGPLVAVPYYLSGRNHIHNVSSKVSLLGFLNRTQI